MTRREFTDRVLLPLVRLNWDEREAVRQELEEHIEDRMEALLEMGWKPELAEARCLEAMGDPAEIGREMAAQYRGRGWGWVWLGRAAMVLTAVLCVQAVLWLDFSYTWEYIRDSLDVRSLYVPEGWTFELDTVEATMALDIRVPIGNDVLRAGRINVGREEGRDALRAEVLLFSYDRIPGGVVAESVLNCAALENQRGGEDRSASGGWGHARAGRVAVYTDVEPGDTYVTLVHEWLGKTVRVPISLPEREEP